MNVVSRLRLLLDRLDAYMALRCVLAQRALHDYMATEQGYSCLVMHYSGILLVRHGPGRWRIADEASFSMTCEADLDRIWRCVRVFEVAQGSRSDVYVLDMFLRSGQRQVFTAIPGHKPCDVLVLPRRKRAGDNVWHMPRPMAPVRHRAF